MTLSDDSDRKALDRLHDTWTASVQRGDAEALRDLVTDDYEVWAHGAEPIRGPDAVVRAMRAALALYHAVQRLEVLETIVAGDWAFQRTIEHITGTPVSGGDAITRSQRALLILHRGADGRWRYARGMTNGLPPTDTTRPEETRAGVAE